MDRNPPPAGAQNVRNALVSAHPVIHIDIIARSSISASNNTRKWIESFVGWPKDFIEHEDAIASGDKAVARVRLTGTHQGEFMGIPATGKSAVVDLIDFTRFGDDGLAREHWGVADQLALMQQLGVIPVGPPA